MSQLPVVVGYNTSEHAVEPLAWAGREAVRRGVPLVVLFAANVPGMVTAERARADLEPGTLDAARAVTERGVRQVRRLCPSVAVSGQTVATSPTAALIEASSYASLLVVGSRGRGSVLAGLLGSVAYSVAGVAQCPLVVVKSGQGRVVAGPLRPVVVGTDGSPAAQAALCFAAGEAERAQAALRVVCCTGEVAVPGVALQPLREAAEQVLRRASVLVSRTHSTVSVTTQLLQTVPERALVDASTTSGLMVVGSRGRGAFGRMLAGSTACAVIHAAACPVAVVGEPRRLSPAPRAETAEHGACAGPTSPCPWDVWGWVLRQLPSIVAAWTPSSSSWPSVGGLSSAC